MSRAPVSSRLDKALVERGLARSREDAERHCLAAIGFTLEAMAAEGEEPPPGEVTEYEVQLVPASR